VLCGYIHTSTLTALFVSKEFVGAVTPIQSLFPSKLKYGEIKVAPFTVPVYVCAKLFTVEPVPL
jgi:hypothetical protein